MRRLCKLGIGAVLLVVCGVHAHAEGRSVTLAQFERIKSLVGTWAGRESSAKASEAVVLEYRLSAGGAAVIERIFMGSP